MVGKYHFLSLTILTHNFRSFYNESNKVYSVFIIKKTNTKKLYIILTVNLILHYNINNPPATTKN
jgi:hypothetical protein